MKKKTNEEFINDIKRIHKNEYDYSLVNYDGAHSKIKIICQKHGIFEQLATNHLSGQKCPKCKGKGKTTTDIINDFKLKHGDKYDYSLVEYIHCKSKVKIICPKHGLFEQTPEKHLSTLGCSRCLGYKKSIIDVITYFKLKHGNKYDYSLVEYAGVNKKVKIICPTHGLFEQSFIEHKNGSGCPKCVGKNKNIDDVINQFKKIHKDKYDYTSSEYLNSATKVKIKCKIHGEFEQLVYNHLKGCNCPKCSFLSTEPQTELNNFINTLNIKTETNNRKILNGLELDVYIPSHNISVEFDGLFWHNELHKPSNYHLNKTIECEKKVFD